MLKNFFVKQMLRAKGVPPEQIELISSLINKNPELFKKIALEIEQKVKSGQKDQMAVAMEVMSKYRSEIEAVMKK